MNADTGQVWHCSFCGVANTNPEVTHMIAGPVANICQGCVSLCNEIIAGEPISIDIGRMEDALNSPRYRLPDRELTLEEIKHYLLHPEECERVEPDEG